ncbi:MAG: hypothetical protein PHR78_01270 [Eubacteriales bacterium]|nr:hypothetical protein [Eubacteriales bacterium]MDD4540788.1 hypothetical protein [Eubacteriales bacterium]
MVGTTRSNKHKRFSCSNKIALSIVAFFIFLILLTAVVLISGETVLAADGDEGSMAAAFDPPFKLPAGLAFNAPGRPLLYSHNSEIPLEIPAASRLMLLLISSEQITADETILISEEAEKLATFEMNTNLKLESGMTLPYRYLMLRLLMQNSDAAALAIAEHISGGEDDFLEIMQQRASELGMINTEFHTVLVSKAERENQAPAFFADPSIDWGSFTYEKNENQGFQVIIGGQPVPTIIPDFQDMEIHTAKINLNDMCLLAQALNSSRSALDYLRVTEQLVSVRVDSGDRVIPMRSNVSRLFTLSEGDVEAAYHHRSERFSLTMSFGQSDGEIRITTLLLSANQSPMIDETLKLYDSIDQYYQRIALTEAGSPVPGHRESTESGESFSLQYLDTVYYVHPKDNFYLKDDVIYVGNAPYFLPIQKGSMTGQIIFEMLDGTRIPVRVGPDRDIISSNTAMARLVSLLYNNANLGRLIIGLAVFICLILIILLIKEIYLLLYWRRMRRLERAGHPEK